MHNKKTIKLQQFISYYYYKKMTKAAIIDALQISESLYNKYLKESKNMIFNEITTDSIEKEIINFYNKTDDLQEKKDWMKIMVDIWKNKNKVNVAGGSEKNDDNFDFSKLIKKRDEINHGENSK